MADINLFPKLQPQLAQLEGRFKAPIIKDSAVELFTDLLAFNPEFNYKHKIVWVREHASNYYLENGDGTNAINWKRVMLRAVIGPYQQTETYQFGETVWLNGKIYSAIESVPQYYNPLDYPAYWMLIAGETITYRYLFFNTASILLYTEIRNPQFEIVLGTIPLDGNDDPIVDPLTGLIIIENPEIVEAVVKERTDLPPNNGKAYEIQFYADGELSEQVSGCVNIK
jgi:hypothetical protein